jgi:TolB-like protein/DNA-binding winged helix-turn-helix (wHTH) protein/Tfp pilus assembly protein PilF
MSSSGRHVLRIGVWRVDPALDVISKDGTTVKLEPRTMRLLVYLAEHAGEVVSVDQLLDHVWKDVVVTPNSVYHAVAALRRVLGDNPKDPTYIVNILRRGYRLVAAVAPWEEESAPAVPESTATQVAAAPANSSAARSSRIRRLGLPLLIALAVACAYFISRPPRKVMLVVLPFTNLTGDARREYFSDGITEELISQLGSLDPDHLGVIARTSAMAYKGSPKDAAQIAHELGVNYLFEGSVRGSSDQVRVTAQLIATADQTHIWAESYDRDAGDVLKLQSEVARTIADKIRLTLSAQTTARLIRTPSLNPQAHEAYLEGLEAANLRTRQGLEQAIVGFERAIALEPNYADAYAQLARTYSLATVVGLGAPTDMMSQARDAAVRALQIDDSIAAAHTTLGFVHAHFEYDWAAAEREFHRGIELNPSDANAHLFYSNSLLSPLGRHEEAIAEMNTAVRLDPLSAPVDSFVGRTYLWARRYDEALARMQEAARRYPNFPLNHVRLAHLYPYLRRFDEAIAEETKARLLSGQDPREALHVEDALRTAFAARGPRGYWEKILELSEPGANRPGVTAPEAYSTTYGMAMLYARLGDTDKSIESLERAYIERQLAMTEIGVEPALDSLRSDGRFTNLLRRVGLSH